MGEKGFFISNLKRGDCLKIKLPSGDFCYVKVEKTGENRAEVMVKVPTDATIKKVSDKKP